MTEYSAQGSITVRRLRTGGSLYITLENNGIPLYQGVDPESGLAKPDWTVAKNQPIITPKVVSTRGNKVTLQQHRWSYNGTLLKFNTGSGWVAETSEGRFMLNVDTGAIKIVKNLASKTNIANDMLTYQCQAVVAGVEYQLTKSVDIAIQNTGASSYYGTVNATTEQLTSDVTTSTIKTSLFLAGTVVNEYYMKWYKDDTLWSEQNGKKQISIGRDDVNGTQLIIAEFYKTSSDATPVFRAGLRIIDTLDEFVVVCYISSTNKEVDDGSPVTVSAKIVNTKTNATLSPSSASWRMDVMDRKTWARLKTASTNSISITTTETDRNGEENDVEVVGEVTWN